MRNPKSQAELDEIIHAAYKRENGAQIYDELRQTLCILNLMDVKSMIEIGSENGGSLSVWLKMWDELNVFCVDADVYGIKSAREDRVARWSSWLGPKQTLDVVWGDSHAVSTQDALKTAIGSRGLSSVDLLYHDGDHSEAGTEQDVMDYGPLVHKGGLVLVTDIHPYPGREDVGGWKWWNRYKPSPITQYTSREPHQRDGWQIFDTYHDKGKQSSFGWGWVFK